MGRAKCWTPADGKRLGLGLRLGETQRCEEGVQHFSGQVSVDLLLPGVHQSFCFKHLETP